jgi:hypothetical protein
MAAKKNIPPIIRASKNIPIISNISKLFIMTSN